MFYASGAKRANMTLVGFAPMPASLFDGTRLMAKKILVMGLPGAGKTTLSRVLAPLLGAVWFNADEIRANINKDLGFSADDRIEQARRMGWLCDQVVRAGLPAMADFVCPTPETRAAFGSAFVIWVDRIDEGRFADTNRLFVAPRDYDVRVLRDGSPDLWAERIKRELSGFAPPDRSALQR
jgi:adenylylsulfate kinase